MQDWKKGEFTGRSLLAAEVVDGQGRVIGHIAGGGDDRHGHLVDRFFALRDAALDMLSFGGHDGECEWVESESNPGGEKHCRLHKEHFLRRKTALEAALGC